MSSDLTTAVRRGECPHIRNGDTGLQTAFETGQENTSGRAERDSIPGRFLQSPTPLPYGNAIRWHRVLGHVGMPAGPGSLSKERQEREARPAWPGPQPTRPASTRPGLCVCDNGCSSLFQTRLSPLVPSESQFLRRRTRAIVSSPRFLALGSGLCTQGHSTGSIDRLAQALSAHVSHVEQL